MRRLVTTIRLVALGFLLPSLGIAQALPEAQPSSLTPGRQQLQELLTGYEQVTASPAYSAEFQARARTEAELLRERLKLGDFRVGDRISLTVEGEEQLSGEFVVQPNRVLVLPVLGEISLAGVLRSELEAFLTDHLQNYIRAPQVHARASIRLLITGAVAKQGFFPVPAQTVLSDVIMAAGGPASNAKLTDIRVERDGKTIWKGKALQEAIIEGRTLDQLSMRAGDHIVVPVKRTEGFGSTLRTTLMVLSPIVLVLSRLGGLF